MSIQLDGRKPFTWTVARMLKVLATGARVPGRQGPTLWEIEERLGLSSRELLRLAKRLSLAEDCSPAGHFPLQLFLESGPEQGRRIVAQGAGALLRLSRLGKADAALAADALGHLAVEPEATVFCRGLAARLRGAAGQAADVSGFYYHPSDPPALSKKVALVKEALDRSRTLSFEYRGYAARSAGRVADPLSLRRDNEVWRVLGWDHQRAEARTFVIDSMAKIVVTEHAFEWPQGGLSPELARARDLSAYQPTGKEQEVRLKVSSRVAEEWKKAFKKVGKPGKGGWREAVLLIGSPDWLVRSFLPRVDEVKVLGPDDVKRRWKEEILALAGRV
ncbi:MAG: helix-turn-helix transcriptional regulator [bacterium]